MKKKLNINNHLVLDRELFLIVKDNFGYYFNSITYEFFLIRFCRGGC